MLGIEAISLSMYSIVIAFHSFSICIIKSLQFLKILWPIWRFTIIQRFSIGLRSGDWQNVNLVFIKPRFHCVRSMLGSLSCWNVHKGGISLSAYGNIVVLKIFLKTYFVILSMIRLIGSTHSLEKQPHTMTFPPPCLTVPLM